ncbi:MAG: class I SAM-dependent DNA methyltransferase, partial [Syntrophomonadaceae bacterium]
MAKAKAKKENNESLEQTLWKTADKLRKNMDAAEYKHIVLGLIFLKYISDAFEDLYQKLIKGEGEYEGADPEDINEYRAENVFYVPPQARWGYLQGRAKLPTIGKDIDNAMEAIERDNPSLKGVLPKQYARPNLDKQSLGGLIDLIGTIALGDEAARSRDILGQVYEYFLGQFALAEGKKGGQFYTPRSVVQLLVEMLEPYEGRVFDPCCGSGGMFVQSEKFIRAHNDRYKNGNGKGLPINPADRISIYGQESNQTTWRLCKMNLAIRGIDSSNVFWNSEGSFLNDAHPDLKADFVIANPPFNDSDWSGELLRTDGRWKYGVPPISNANYAWIQHFIYHLSPKGTAGFVLAKGSLSSKTNGEGEIRRNIIEA